MTDSKKTEIESENTDDPIANQGPLENAEKLELSKSKVDSEQDSDSDSDDDFEDDESESEIDHPLDILQDVIDSIKSQIIRVKRTKSIHNLKQELQYNIYPTLLRGFETIADYISGIEQEDEDAITQEIAMNQLKEVLEVCLKVRFFKNIVQESLIDQEYEKTWKEVTDWADEIISQTHEDIVKEVTKDIPVIQLIENADAVAKKAPLEKKHEKISPIANQGP